MINIPENTGDNKQNRMDKFVSYVLEQLNLGKNAEIYDYDRGNDNKVPAISEWEARELAEMFIKKGYHANAYYIDCPCHGFRSVRISKGVLFSSSHKCAHTDLWG